MSQSELPRWGGNLDDGWLRAKREVMRPVLEMSKAFDQAFKPVQDALASWRREISRITTELSDSLGLLVDLLERYLGICIVFGWPPSDVPLSVIGEVVSLYDEKGLRARSEVDAVFVGLHSKKVVRDVLDEWREWQLLRRRIHILEAAIRAHLRGDYALSVPVLLASLEGVVADLHVPHGRMRQADYRRLLAETFSGTDVPDRWATRLNDAARSVIADVMVGSFVHGDPPPLDLKRNAVLHGADVSYDNEVYSLKAILMLDLIREQYRFVALDQSEVFHREECVVLRRSTRRGRHYKTAADAELDSRRACVRCRPDQRV